MNDPTASELASRLRALTRYSRNVANYGNGNIDTWDSPEDDGEYVLWADVQKLAEEIESGKATIGGTQFGQPVRKGNMGEKHKGECRTCWMLCCCLAQMCAADPATVVDKLTGYLWDEEEAGEIKANSATCGKADAEAEKG